MGIDRCVARATVQLARARRLGRPPSSAYRRDGVRLRRCRANPLSPWYRSLYIAEIAPSGSRGRLVVLNQIATVIGLLAAQIVKVALGTVESWGRRRLLLVGCAGLAIIYAAVGAGYVMGVQGWPLLLLVVTAIATYATTLAPVTWVALSEIFPGEAHGASMAIATTALWAACFLLTYTFPLLTARARTGVTFWIYGAICAAGFIMGWPAPSSRHRV
nr:MFS transporter [Sphingomonas sp. BT553]